MVQILLLILGASTFAVPAAVWSQPMVPAVAVKRPTPGVLKNGDSGVIQCAEELPDGSWRMVMEGFSDSPCNLNLPNGVFLRLWEGEIITTEVEGNFAHGTTARVYTSGLPYHLFGDQRHLIEPNAIIEIVIEEGLTHILSKEGRTSVVACEVSEDSACVRRGFTLLEGDLISLMREGQVYAWENADGDDLTLESNGGCSVGTGSRPSFWIVLMMWTLMVWLRRRSKKATAKTPAI